jgi:hypothetical protein
MLRDASANEVSGSGTSEIVRCPTDEPGPGDTLEAVTLYCGRPLARGSPCIKVGEYRLAAAVEYGGDDQPEEPLHAVGVGPLTLQ